MSIWSITLNTLDVKVDVINDGFLNSMIGKRSQMQNANDLGFDLSEYDRSQPFGFGIMAKKGGRIVKGKKAAVRRKANRSKKK